MARFGRTRRLARPGLVLTSVLLIAGCGAGGGSVAAGGVATPSGGSPPQAMAGMNMSMSGTPPTGTPDAGAQGTAVPAAVLRAIAGSLDSVPGVSYTFSVTGSDMMSVWPSGHGTVQGTPTPGLDADIEQVMSMGHNSGSMEFRSLGGQLWVRSARYDQGKAWAVVPADESTNPQAQGMHTQVDQLDPRLQLKLVLASGNMHATTQGTSLPGTTHYVGEVSSAQLAAASALDANTRAALAKAYPSLAIKPLEIDVWVDSQQHPVRLGVVSPTPEGSLQMEMDFSGYGTPAGLTAPTDTIPLATNS